MSYFVIGGVLALAGVILIVARSSVSRLNEQGNRKMGANDRKEKPLDYDKNNSMYAGVVLLIVGAAMIVGGFVSK